MSEIWIDQFDNEGNRIAQQIYHNQQITTLLLPIPTPLPIGNFEVRVRAITVDGNGNVVNRSPWSARQNFTIS
ncbi:MAG: hypothetical protein R3C59_12350 [Planctomycetaceae bacterium]